VMDAPAVKSDLILEQVFHCCCCCSVITCMLMSLNVHLHGLHSDASSLENGKGGHTYIHTLIIDIIIIIIIIKCFC